MLMSNDEPQPIAGPACRAAREAAGISQAEVARRCGVAATVVARWESGRHALLETTLTRYAAALGKRVRFAFEDA